MTTSTVREPREIAMGRAADLLRREVIAAAGGVWPTPGPRVPLDARTVGPVAVAHRLAGRQGLDPVERAGVDVGADLGVRLDELRQAGADEADVARALAAVWAVARPLNHDDQAAYRAAVRTAAEIALEMHPPSPQEKQS